MLYPAGWSSRHTNTVTFIWSICDDEGVFRNSKLNNACLCIQDPSYNETDDEMAIARAARDAMSKHGHGLPKITVGSAHRWAKISGEYQ